MLKLKNLTVKNFMSVGNVSQAVNLDKNHLTLVLGENTDRGGDTLSVRNGTGKTTIINALSYALYGQALTNIKKTNLVNKTNAKNMLVTLSFEKNNTKYRIERGRSPNIFKLFINDQEQEVTDESQGDSRNTQQELELILGMSHTMFKNIVALNTYSEPFLSMRASDQRTIIEQLLGITILSEKADKLKEQIKISKNSIQEETFRINAIQSSNERIKDTIKNLKKNQQDWHKKHQAECSKIQRSIQELEKLDIDQELENHRLLEKWNQINSTQRSLIKEKSNYETAVIQSEKQINKLKNDLDELESAVCYACGQSLHQESKHRITQEKQQELDDINQYQLSLDEKIQAIDLELSQIQDLESRPQTFYDSARDAYEHKSNVSNLKNILEEKLKEQDPFESQIISLENEAIQEIDWTYVNSLNSFKDSQEFLLKLLTNKDSFIRKKIIEQNLSYLNTRLSYYLDSLKLPHRVVFLSDLSVEITQFGQDLDFDNLSRGERNRLILGLSFAFRDVWEGLYQKINLLFIDELIDNGMDTEGVESSISILKNMSRTQKKSVFLISHKEELVSRVNNILKVVKSNNFTSYNTDEEVSTWESE